ncbi:DUF3099 domain-containing protein [Streptomyces sp. ITFR-6]|uniref:DUF3099 domain-containing protein n=1 Tax=Streptomyces sp. ITFR-6 TaxID=3075197 RepID=UPI00288B5D11|nr:DUF3099 domain-containing protein [Streptomyces sp. ITFR-6]WNI30258.1 DUF3099 domain-containing protein [Streptomyces sp. ITFR-6]
MYARRRRAYFLMMGGCLVLFVSSWAFVRLWSIPAAISMCVIAMVIPPVAAIVANRKGPEDRWWDDPPQDPRQRTDRTDRADRTDRTDRTGRTDKWNPTGDPESDAWWDELDGRKRRQ